MAPSDVQRQQDQQDNIQGAEGTTLWDEEDARWSAQINNPCGEENRPDAETIAHRVQPENPGKAQGKKHD